MINEGSVLKPSAARRRRSVDERSRQATLGWEKSDWGGQFATRPDNASHDGWEKLYHGEEVNDKVKENWEGIHENSFGHDKRDQMTYHARQDQNKRISKQTRIALEQKAAKALLVAKALLGKKATAESLEDQAAELMDLPTRTLNSTLKRVFSADGEFGGEAGGADMTEDQLKVKVEELLSITEQAETKAVEVAEAAGVPVPEKSEEKAEEAPVDAAPAVEAPAAEEAPVSEDEIQGILFGEGSEEKASSTDESFYAVTSLVDQLFEGAGINASKEDEVAEIEKKLASNQKTGVKKLVAMNKSDTAQDEVASLWKTLPDVSEIFANRRR